jgi:hypothetical protein
MLPSNNQRLIMALQERGVSCESRQQRAQRRYAEEADAHAAGEEARSELRQQQQQERQKDQDQPELLSSELQFGSTRNLIITCPRGHKHILNEANVHKWVKSHEISKKNVHLGKIPRRFVRSSRTGDWKPANSFECLCMCDEDNMPASQCEAGMKGVFASIAEAGLGFE